MITLKEKYYYLYCYFSMAAPVLKKKNPNPPKNPQKPNQTLKPA